jgi:hypothetical protein
MELPLPPTVVRLVLVIQGPSGLVRLWCTSRRQRCMPSSDRMQTYPASILPPQLVWHSTARHSTACVLPRPPPPQGGRKKAHAAHVPSITSQHSTREPHAAATAAAVATPSITT